MNGFYSLEVLKFLLLHGFEASFPFLDPNMCLVLKLQAEAQEALINDVSNLCDVAEALSSVQEEQLKQSLFDLPVWASPQELMAALCDE